MKQTTKQRLLQILSWQRRSDTDDADEAAYPVEVLYAGWVRAPWSVASLAVPDDAAAEEVPAQTPARRWTD